MAHTNAPVPMRRVALTAILACIPAAGCHAVGPMPRTADSDRALLAMARTHFDNALAMPFHGRPFRQFLHQMSRSGRSHDYYTLFLALDALLTMYEVTHESAYLEEALTLSENMVRAANRDRDGDGHPEWDGQYKGRYFGDRPDTLLYDLQGSLGLARLAAVVRRDRAASARFGRRVEPILAFVSDHIVRKWLVDRGEWANMLRRHLWSDKLSLLGTIEIFRYRASGDPQARRRAETLARRLRTNFLRHDPRNDAWLFLVSAPDTAHTNREVYFMIECFREGIVFTRQDIDRLANTFTRLIWDGSLENPRLRNYHTGRNDPVGRRGPWENSQFYNGWAMLGRYDPRSHAVTVALWKQVISNRFSNPSVGYNASPYGRMGLAAQVARNIVMREWAVDGPPPPAAAPASGREGL